MHTVSMHGFAGCKVHQMMCVLRSSTRQRLKKRGAKEGRRGAPLSLFNQLSFRDDLDWAVGRTERAGANDIPRRTGSARG